MASPLSKLPDDLIRELFLLLPTAQDPTPRVLGFLTNARGDSTVASRFVVNNPAASGRPAARARDLPGLRVLDSRHSRVLFLTPSPSPGAVLTYSLVVWIPLTNEYSCLPQPEPPLTGAPTITNYVNAAVLCGAAACDHRNCHGGGNFRVALVYLNFSARVMSVRVYSSVTSGWSAPRFAQCPVGHLRLMPCHPSTLVGDTLYFRRECGYFLEYQLGVQQLSFVQGPPQYHLHPWNFSLMPMKDGVLGCMYVEDDMAGLRLRKCSREAAGGADGVAQWTKGTAIEIKDLLPSAALQSMELLASSSAISYYNHSRPRKLESLGSAEGTGVIFLGTWFRGRLNAVYMVQVNNSGGRTSAEKVFDVSDVVVPYISSHIPVPATAPN